MSDLRDEKPGKKGRMGRVDIGETLVVPGAPLSFQRRLLFLVLTLEAVRAQVLDV